MGQSVDGEVTPKVVPEFQAHGASVLGVLGGVDVGRAFGLAMARGDGLGVAASSGLVFQVWRWDGDGQSTSGHSDGGRCGRVWARCCVP